VLEIDPRHQPAQETAGEQTDIDMRRLQRVAAAGHATRTDGGEAEAPLGVAGATPEAAEGGIERLRLLVLGMGIATLGVGLPDLEGGIGHRRAVAAEHAADDLQPLALRVRADERLRARPTEGEVEERSDGLRRRLAWHGSAQRRRLRAAAQHDVEAIAERP